MNNLEQVHLQHELVTSNRPHFQLLAFSDLESDADRQTSGRAPRPDRLHSHPRVQTGRQNSHRRVSRSELSGASSLRIRSNYCWRRCLATLSVVGRTLPPRPSRDIGAAPELSAYPPRRHRSGAHITHDLRRAPALRTMPTLSLCSQRACNHILLFRRH